MKATDLSTRTTPAPTRRRRTIALLLLPLTIVALLVAVYAGLTISSALRAYVTAQGRWTQERKMGVQQLTRYALTHDERDYRAYVESQRIPDEDRRARAALMGGDRSVDAAAERFVAAGSSPDDAADMARMYRWLAPLPYFRRAADLWPQADAEREVTDRQARALHDVVRLGARDTARVRALLDSIGASDARASAIEREFSSSLGEGSRAMSRAIMLFTAAVGIILIVAGTIVGMRLYEHERTATAVVHQRAQEFRALVEHAPDIIFRINRELRITYVNPAIERATGIAPLAVVGRSAEALRVADDRATELEAVVLDVFGSGRDSTMELELDTPGGRRSFHVRLTPERAADRSIEAVLAIAGDITELKASERALREQDQQIRHAQKMEAVGRLASGVAHEFNNLLTVLAGSLDLAREELARGGGDPLKEIGVARQAADRAYGLTRQLLAFNPRKATHHHLVHVTDSIRQLETMFTRVIGEHIRVETRLDADTPDVRMDRGDLEQIVLNLVVNARDAMPDGGTLRIHAGAAELPPTLSAGADAAPADGWMVLEVSDTGVGMDEETKSHLFEPFFTTKSRDLASGLGLSTLYGIVRSLGGQVTAESELGAGATFRVYLPAAQARPEDATASPQRTSRGSESVLVMEDEPAVRDLAQRVLTRQGYTVIEAANGEEALARLDERGGRVDLVLSDVISPVMGGRALAAVLEQRGVDVPMVFMSGYTDSDVPLRGARGEVAPLLAKPFTTDELLSIVRRALDGAT